MSADLVDRWGVPTGGSDPAALQQLDDAVLAVLSMRGEPAALAASAAAADANLLLAPIAQAELTLYGTSATSNAQARAILDTIAPRIPDAPIRERLHFEAACAWADGRRELAARRLDEALLQNPHDLLALRVAQDIYNYLGDARDLRDSVARVVCDWDEGEPGYGWVQGMYSFGLQEAGDYRRAEQAARNALAANPRDVWASHSLAHTFDMDGRPEEGLEFMDASAASWQDSYFANHNWIHAALFHLELGDFGALLPIYDDGIRAHRELQWTRVLDCASALWRLALFGVDVRARASSLVDGVCALLSAPVFALDDWHALMIFSLAGREDLVDWVLRANRAVTPGTTNYDVLHSVGLDLLDGFAAFGAGNYEAALDHLQTARPRSHEIGGSTVRRDAFDLTLIAAAARSGDELLLRALRCERIALRPTAQLSTDALIAANRAAATPVARSAQGRARAALASAV